MKLLVLLLAIMIPQVPHAQDFKARLVGAASKKDLRDFCSKFKAFGEVRESEYTSSNRRLFLCWAERDGVPVFLFGYVLRNSRWQLLIDHPENISLAGAHVVVSIADDSVRLIGKNGDVLKSYSLATP
mgnify:CR=1 FL=1